MSTETSNHESFEEFKTSFSYGGRNDLNFKFLAKFSDEEAATFLQELLRQVGDACDDGALDRIFEHIHEGQVRAYAGGGQWEYQSGPFSPLQKSLAESRVALLTSSGHFVEGNDPNPFGIEDMTQEEAIARIGEFLRVKPKLSVIPVTTPRDHLRVRHGGYDIHGALRDPNVVFPYQRLNELQQQGIIGEFFREAYSFVGACSQIQLKNDIGPDWVKIFQAKEIEAVVMVPV